MEDYYDYPAGHKDHHYWPTVKWDAEYSSKPAKVGKPKYRDWEEVEADGSITYYSVMITDPVVIDGMMV